MCQIKRKKFKYNNLLKYLTKYNVIFLFLTSRMIHENRYISIVGIKLIKGIMCKYSVCY